MAIARKPEGNQTISNDNRLSAEQQGFIANAGKTEQGTEPGRKNVAVLLRIDPETLERIDRAAKNAGLKRAAYILSSAVERMNRAQ